MSLRVLFLSAALTSAVFSSAACDDEPSLQVTADTASDTSTSDGAVGDTQGPDASDVLADSADTTSADVLPDIEADVGSDIEADTDPGSVAFQKYKACFPYLVEALDINIELDAVVADSCSGTDHQTIDDVDKIVVLGDSISAGTGASGDEKTYFELLRADLEAHYGHSITLESCAVGGSINANLMGQINNCFPGTENEKTLVVFTSGGNDIANMAINKLNTDAGLASVDAMVGYLDAGVAFFDDEAKFPNGVFVVFADVYEYTDATADMESCPLATFAGLTGTWAAGLSVFAYLTSEYGRVATKYGRDVVFMEETFCGHGYAREEPASPCNEVAGELWFGFDCIHPNDLGHRAIADLFFSVVTDGASK